MTKLDRVTCSADYELVENEQANLRGLSYQSCDVPCHEECMGGCNQRNNSRFCMECKNDKFYFSASRFDCIPSCHASYPDGAMPVTQVMISAALTDITTGDIINSGGTNGVASTVKAFIPIEGTCRLCHAECAYGCRGTTNRHCISENIAYDPYNKGCLNVQVRTSLTF